MLLRIMCAKEVSDEGLRHRIGYVAVYDDVEEIARLGHRNVVIAYRVTGASFGGPRVGNKRFRCQLEKNGTNVLRIVNSDDPISKVPGFVIDDDVDDNGWSGHCYVADRAMAELRDRWMEFQGIKNWEGLLDPLDDDLRKEILRYGEFVEAAYRCFDFDMSSPSYATCLYPKSSMLMDCGLNKSAYKVIKNLYATCATRMPRWTKRFPNLASPQSSWIGYVAVCDEVEEIARLGRHNVVIAYRGTATSSEWLENLRATLTCLPDDMAPENYDQPMVQSGFLSLYTTNTQRDQSLQDTIREQIGNILDKYSDEPLSITVTGHSLGAALATLTAYDITNKFSDAHIVTVVSFGGPRVGNKSFRCQLEKSGQLR
ncbi:Phospholipase A(1) DAD1, chloroplastic [Capsicum baccatum]|uniref:Phospholipase A(1) DAD1, chloroplastic n=1 Tax=Capsicum baccatum TaxID=33114 RepID=A0A2G2WV09_CAPBA|nr:Phospholipase A(1) DAD1, chloroplastic [Capsicum baccatum]